MHSTSRIARAVAIVPKRSCLLLVAALFALSACTGSPSTSSVTPDSPSARADEVETAARLMDSVAYVDTSGKEPQIRVGGRDVTPGDKFAISDNGLRMAVLLDDKLSVMSLDGSHPTLVSSGVTGFQWRPGTEELLYGTYVKGNIEWRRYKDEQAVRDTVLIRGRFPPTVSPSGKWLVYSGLVDGPEQLTAVDLDGSNTLSYAGGDQGFPAFQFVGSDTLSYFEDWRRIVLLSLSSGDRQVFVEEDVDLLGPMRWVADGTRVAVASRKDGLRLWNQTERLGVCTGTWKPIAWSASGRYLAVEQGTSRSLFIMDTTELPNCNLRQIPGKWTRLAEWHPRQDVLLLSMARSQDKDGQIEVWGITGDPNLIGVVGKGRGATWVALASAKAVR